MTQKFEMTTQAAINDTPVEQQQQDDDKNVNEEITVNQQQQQQQQPEEPKFMEEEQSLDDNNMETSILGDDNVAAIASDTSNVDIKKQKKIININSSMLSPYKLINNNNNNNNKFYSVSPRPTIRQRNTGINQYNRRISSNELLLHSPASEFVHELKKYHSPKETSFQRSMFLWSLQMLTWIQRLIITYINSSNIPIRLIIYSCVIITGGLIKEYIIDDVDVLPTTVHKFIMNNIRTSKRSILNVYFVKWGWLWTLISLIPYFLFTRIFFLIRSKKNHQSIKNVGVKNYETVTSDNQQQQQQQENKSISISSFIHKCFMELINPFLRLFLTTIIWYFSVNLFVHIGTITGHCQSKDNTKVFLRKTYNECIGDGNRWILGLDISGHLFLMTFSNLIIMEELCYLFARFEEFYEFRFMAKFQCRQRAQRFVSPYLFKYDSLIHWFGLLLTSIMFMIMIIWDFMMIQTTFFYHNLLQKVLGYLWALCSWMLIYRLIPRILSTTTTTNKTEKLNNILKKLFLVEY